MQADLSKLTSYEILALTIYGEARGESIEGQVAVGCVIRNRLDKNTYYDVCMKPRQFSCWNIDDVNYLILIKMSEVLISGKNIIESDFQQCLWVATGIIGYLIKDNTNGAKYYITNKLFHSDNRPKWAKTPAGNVKQIDNQTFFNI